MGEFWAVLGVGLATFAGSLIVQIYGAGRMRGEFGIRMQNAESDISELKDDQRLQWDKISKHGERIARIEPSRPNGGARG